LISRQRRYALRRSGSSMRAASNSLRIMTGRLS
jgi:hypothetical protein